MPDLHLIGVHEDGRHLVLASRQGEEFFLPLDDRLRALARREHPTTDRPSPRSAPREPMRPTEVQAMIRAGADAAEAAERAGWSIEKVHRYEGPILAERAHVATVATGSHVRDRAGDGSHPTTLAQRVRSRLVERGLDPDATDWDAWRSEDAQWTVELRFVEAGRSRVASWHFSRSSMTVTPIDDEAARLSGAPAPRSTPDAGPLPAPATPRTPHPEERRPARDDDADLLTTMRERSAARSRRRPGRRAHDDTRTDTGALDAVTAGVESAPQATRTDAHDLPVDVRPAGQATPHAAPCGPVPAPVGTQDRTEVAPPAAPAPSGTPTAGIDVDVNDGSDDDTDLTPAPDDATNPTPARDDVTTDDATTPDTAAPITHDPSTRRATSPITHTEAVELPADTGAHPRPESRPEPKPTTPEPPAVDRPAPKTTGRRRPKGRSSVPAWDDIMFGAKRANDDG